MPQNDGLPVVVVIDWQQALVLSLLEWLFTTTAGWITIGILILIGIWCGIDNDRSQRPGPPTEQEQEEAKFDQEWAQYQNQLQAWERYGGPRPVEPSRGPLPPPQPTYGNGYQYQRPYVPPTFPPVSEAEMKAACDDLDRRWRLAHPGQYLPPSYRPPINVPPGYHYIPPGTSLPPSATWANPQLPPRVPQPWDKTP